MGDVMSSSEGASTPVGRRAAVMKAVPRLALLMLLFSASLFIPAGRLDWVAAWVYLGMVALHHLTAMFTMDPELVLERLGALERREGRQRWDVVASFTTGYTAPVSTMIVAGLDARFGWSQGMLGAQLVAGAAMLPAFLLIAWAARTNRFFSAVVRIQKERGHSVVSEGPYRFVRHPGYAGFIVYMVAAPVVLGSWWGLIPGAFGAGALVVRAALEDRTLRRELEGYEAYTRRVKYRLLPGAW
jgi:protein-S-isoprenylcysteine O-methyltransferase Ste14